MPASADRFGSRPNGRSDPEARPPASRASGTLRLRLAVAVHRPSLTQALADGVSTEMNTELALRARQLTSTRTRRTLARSLRGVIKEAHEPARLSARVVIVRRGAVLAAERALTDLIERLESPAPVRAQGVAAAELILTDGDRSPLYSPCEPATLRRAARVALADLEPDPSLGHEFSLSV